MSRPKPPSKALVSSSQPFVPPPLELVTQYHPVEMINRYQILGNPVTHLLWLQIFLPHPAKQLLHILLTRLKLLGLIMLTLPLLIFFVKNLVTQRVILFMIWSNLISLLDGILFLSIQKRQLPSIKISYLTINPLWLNLFMITLTVVKLSIIHFIFTILFHKLSEVLLINFAIYLITPFSIVIMTILMPGSKCYYTRMKHLVIPGLSSLIKSSNQNYLLGFGDGGLSMAPFQISFH